MSSSGTYSCDYQLPRRVIHATGIPTHSKLGAIPCSWTDPTPQLCKEEGEIACLWGCTNADPKLGWKKRAFNTLNDFVEEVTSKGYHKTAKYAAYGSYGYDYTRGIGYGYRYESWWNKNTKMGYSEGPEPNPEANWYGFSHGFWPELTFLWHDTC